MLLKSTKQSKLLVIIIGCFLCVRSIHLWQFYHSVLFKSISGDEITHFKWMKVIVLGKYQLIIPFFRAPLYGFFLAFIWIISNCSLLAIYFTQIILEMGTTLLIFFIGIQLFSPLTALIASLILCFYPLSIYYSHQLLIVTLFTFLSTASVFFFITSIKREKVTFLAVVFCALATLTRPNMLIFSILVIIYLAISRKSIKYFIKYCLLYLAIIFLPLLISGISSQNFSFISTQGGINFYAGNNSKADGIIPAVPNCNIENKLYYKIKKDLKNSVWATDNMWEASHIIVNSRKNESKLSSSQISSWWYKETFKEIHNNYIRFSKLILKKMIFLIAYYEAPNNSDFNYAVIQFFPFIRFLHKIFNFAFLWAFCAPGILIAIKQKKVVYNILLLYLLSMSSVLIMFFVNSRFRVPLVPVMSIFAVITVKKCYYLLKNKLYQNFLVLLLLILVSGFSSFIYLIYPESYLIRASKALYHSSLSQKFKQHNLMKKALVEIDHAIELDTLEKFIFLFNKAKLILVYKASSKEIVELLKESISIKKHPVVMLYLAKLYIDKLKFEDAKMVLDQLLKIDPEHIEARKIVENFNN